MTILGFTFSSELGMGAQVEAIKRKFYARKWILHHLGHACFSEADLLRVYKSVILPIHYYCSCVYNSSLTQNQVSVGEAPLKAIYGYKHSYRALLGMTGLQTLKERRDMLEEKNALKCREADQEPTDLLRDVRKNKEAVQFTPVPHEESPEQESKHSRSHSCKLNLSTKHLSYLT